MIKFDQCLSMTNSFTSLYHSHCIMHWRYMMRVLSQMQIEPIVITDTGWIKYTDARSLSELIQALKSADEDKWKSRWKRNGTFGHFDNFVCI